MKGLLVFLLSVAVASCAPNILLAKEAAGGAIGAGIGVAAGWKGAALGAAGAAVEKFKGKGDLASGTRVGELGSLGSGSNVGSDDCEEDSNGGRDSVNSNNGSSGYSNNDSHSDDDDAGSTYLRKKDASHSSDISTDENKASETNSGSSLNQVNAGGSRLSKSVYDNAAESDSKKTAESSNDRYSQLQYIKEDC